MRGGSREELSETLIPVHILSSDPPSPLYTLIKGQSGMGGYDDQTMAESTVNIVKHLLE